MILVSNVESKRRVTTQKRGANPGTRSGVPATECVGLEAVDDGVWAVYFGPVLLGKFHVKVLKLYGAYS